MQYVCSNTSVLDKTVVPGSCSQSLQAIRLTVSASMALASPIFLIVIVIVITILLPCLCST